MENSINLVNQKVLTIIGVGKVKNVSPNEIVLELNDQTLVVLGSDLEVQSLDLENKKLIVIGTITAIKYQAGKQNFFKRIFK